MKTILTSLINFERLEETMDAAIHIARQNDGHVIGYYPIPGVSLIRFVSPSADFPVDDVLKRRYEKHLPEVKSKFEDRMRRSGVKYEWRKDIRTESDLAKGILEHGREADLIIMAHDARGSKDIGEKTTLIADVILGGGRPVLVVPPAEGKPFESDRIMIGWNASREACRAVFDSLPLLVKASNVILAWINPEKKLGKTGRLPGTELAAALARHDVHVTVKGISNRNRASKTIVNIVKEQDIDLLVVGAYGHSRLREQILGGVTEHVLRNLPCPVLFSN